MSVINKMLKDLEQNSVPQHRTSVPLRQENSNQPLVKLSIFLLLSVVLVLAAKIYLPDNKVKTNRTERTTPQPLIEPRTETVNLSQIPQKSDTIESSQPVMPTTNFPEDRQTSLSKTPEHTVISYAEVEKSNKKKLDRAHSISEKITQTNTRINSTSSHKDRLKKSNQTTTSTTEILVNQSRNQLAGSGIYKQKKHPEKRARQLWEQAESEPVYAEHYLQEALRLDPELHGARLQLIALQISKQQINAAENTVNQGLSLSENDARYIEWKARLLLAADKKQQAKNWLLKSTPPLLTHINYYGLLAGIDNQLGDYQASQTLYQRLVKQQPGHGPWLLGLALAQQKMGNKVAAKTTYVQAVTAAGLSGRARAFIQQQLKKLEH